MSVIESPLDASAQRAYEITIDLRRLQEWSAPDVCAQVAGELDRIRRELMAEGVRERSASRIASALGRYAFLTQEGCSPLPWALWRMYTVDGIPADVLADLTWQHVRPRLRELAVPGGDGMRYFQLGSETCRLLALLRDRRSSAQDASHVFSPQPGRTWDSRCLAEVLEMISVR